MIFSSVSFKTQLVSLCLMNSCLNGGTSFRQTSGPDYCVVRVLISSLKDQLLIEFSDLYLKILDSVTDQQVSDPG